MKKANRSRARGCVTDLQPMVTSHPRGSTWRAAAPRASNPHLEHVPPNVAKQPGIALLLFSFLHLNSPNILGLNDAVVVRNRTGGRPRRGVTLKSARAPQPQPVGTPQFTRAPRHTRARGSCVATATPCGQSVNSTVNGTIQKLHFPKSPAMCRNVKHN